jgi:hypothetical protein
MKTNKDKYRRLILGPVILAASLQGVQAATLNRRATIVGGNGSSNGKCTLDVFIMIDDSSTSNLGLQFDDLRAFIIAQLATTSIGVGYARNGVVQIAHTDDGSQLGRQVSSIAGW